MELQASTSARQSTRSTAPEGLVYSTPRDAPLPEPSITMRVIMASLTSVRLPVRSPCGIGVLAEVYLASTQQPLHLPQ